MVEINLSSDELTVLGGPSEITVETNIGPAGNRGVIFMHGTADPNGELAVFEYTPQLLDVYILTDQSSSDYLTLYQYVSQDGDPQWVPITNLTPNFYSTNEVLTFTAGEAMIEINTVDIGINPNIIGEVDNKHYFNAQVTLHNNGLPSALSITIDDIAIDELTDESYLPITINAAEFDTGSWNAIAGNVVASISISVVDPYNVSDWIGGS
jgi:hypothetical protein